VGILRKEILIMVPGWPRSTKWERLNRLIAGHRLTHRIASQLYRKYDNLKKRREFYSRMKQINPREYLDISRKPNLNIIILVVDCLRNSHLSCQGYFRETTPFLDSFKSRFTAISASPWTYPSVASILTGLYPHNHKAIVTGSIKNHRKLETYRKPRGDVLTLPEMLYFLGYRVYFGTAVYLALYPLRGRVVPKEYAAPARAAQLLDDLTKWIAKERRKTFFAYVHLGDLHIPLNPPHGFKDFFGNVRDLSNIDSWDFAKPQQCKEESEKFQEYRENRQLLYDNTLRYVDHAIERFHNSFQDMGLIDSTILVITADHGEEFWEHAALEAMSFYLGDEVCGISHGINVFNETIQVPLLMSGAVPSRQPDYFVSTADIVPTVIDLLGVKHNMRFDGRNVFETDEERPLLSEATSDGYEKKALVVGRYKLVYSKDDGIEWVFDLEKDPKEQNPITDKEVTSIFVEKLAQILTRDEKTRVKEIIKQRGLSKPSNV
jgi:arylsulfatase A-like enzyme